MFEATNKYLSLPTFINFIFLTSPLMTSPLFLGTWEEKPLSPSPFAAILIGAVGGIIVVYGTKFLFAMKIDDVVGAIPAHMFAGIWGTLAVPLTNPDTSFGAQLLGIVSINVFVFVVAYIVWAIMKNTIGIRLSKEAELKGTDVVETGVIGYAIRD